MIVDHASKPSNSRTVEHEEMISAEEECCNEDVVVGVTAPKPKSKSKTKSKDVSSSSPCTVSTDEYDCAQDMNIMSTSYEQRDTIIEDDTVTHNNNMIAIHDLIGLTQLDEPTILNALQIRYDANIIYTSTGPILIAINPFQKMDHLYSSEVMECYRCEGEGIVGGGSGGGGSSSGNGARSNSGSTPKCYNGTGPLLVGVGGSSTLSDESNSGSIEKLPPHAYKTADDAYRAMKRGLENVVLMSPRSGRTSIVNKSSLTSDNNNNPNNNQHITPTNQSILVSGESGAGKTVTTKIVLHYFARLSKQIAKEEEEKLLLKKSISMRRKRMSLARMNSSFSVGSVTNCAKLDNREGKNSSSNGRNNRPSSSMKNLPEDSTTSTNNNSIGIEQQVLQSNPILEAFGNARTLRNDNSSRFGKYIDIKFTPSGQLAGAKIDTYLLEKVRLIRPSSGERNYHIFYQFLEAITVEERNYLGLDGLGVENFKLLNCGDSGGGGGGVTLDRRDGVVDGEMHMEMLNAMETIGFDDNTIHSILRLITAILHCGNITFSSTHQTTHNSFADSCTIDTTHSSLTAARLLGVKYDDFVQALTYRDILAGSNEVIRSPLGKGASEKGCEALMKAVYGGVFDFIVERVNESMSKRNNLLDVGRGVVVGGSASIGVLDIFGFEIFLTNSYEQLCINYTNEALQQQFNKYVFKLEQTEYEREGINWKWITFPDNQEVLDLIDRRHTGMLALLDEQCIVGSTDAKLARYLYAKCDERPRFSATSAQRADFKFSIEHYAGPVEYCTEQWLEKNNDQLPVSSANLLMGSEFDLLSKIQKFIRSEDRNGRGSVASTSVGAQFSVQLSQLRARIDSTVPHYIRCLKPNEAMVPDSFDPKMIVDQLRCGGVLEAVRVSRAGYPTRYPHDVFKARYYVLGCGQAKDDEVITGEDSEVKQLISKIAFSIWEVDQEAMCTVANGVARPETAQEFLSLDFSSRCTVAGLQLGRTKVFLRREALDRIEALRAQKFGKSVLAIQTFVRGLQARVYFKLFRREMTHFATVIQRSFRRYVERIVLGPAATKVQAIARGAIVRMRLSAQSKIALKRMWIPYVEYEQLQMEFEAAAAERDELLAADAVIKCEIESLKYNVEVITDAKDTESRNLQIERSEKTLAEEEIMTLQSKILEINAGKEAALDSYEQELSSIRQELDETNKAATQEIEKLSTQMSSLETKLLVSKAEEDRLRIIMKSMECIHSESLAFVENEKCILTNAYLIQSKRSDSLSLEVDHANETILSLRGDLDGVIKASRQEQEQHTTKISSLETELHESRREEERLLNLLQSLETNHANALATAESAKEAESQNLQKELAEKILMQQQVSTLKSEVSEIASVEASLEQELASVRQQLDDTRKSASQEQDQLQKELETVTSEREVLSAVNTTMKCEIESLKCNVAEIADAREAESKNLQEELAEKALMQQQMETLKGEMSEIASSKGSLEEELVSFRQQLDDANITACQKQEQLQKELSIVTSEREVLSAVNTTMKCEIESLNRIMADITNAREAESKNLQKELAEKSLIQQEVSNLKGELSDVTSSEKSLEQELSSVRQQLKNTSKAASQEQGKLQTELDTVTSERNVLSAVKTTIECEIESLKRNVAEITDAKETESRNLQKELAEKLEFIAAKDASVDRLKQELGSVYQQLEETSKSASQEHEQLQKELDTVTSERKVVFAVNTTMKCEIESLKLKVAEITDAREAESAEKLDISTAKDATVDRLEQELSSVRQQLEDTKKAFCLEQEQLSSRMSSVETQLLRSKAEEERLGSEMESMECIHSKVVENLEWEKNIVINQNEDLSNQMKSLVSDAESTSQILKSLRTELDGANEAACQEQEQLKSKILLLETQILESRQEKRRLSNLVKSLETSQANALPSSESAAEAEFRNQKEQLSAKISSLMADLSKSKKNENMQEDIILLLKRECEGYHQPNKRGESKMEPLDRNFNDMLSIIQKECSDIIAKSKTDARELESLHGFKILSTEASNFDIRNRGMLQALDAFTNSLVEVVVDGEVKKLLISFCHMIESASASSDMSIEVSLLDQRLP